VRGRNRSVESGRVAQARRAETKVWVPHPLWVFKGAGFDSDLPVIPFGQFSTDRSNGTNKVIDTQGTFLLFSPVFVYTEPRSVQSNFARITTAHRPLTPIGHSTPLLPIASGLFYVNGGPQPLFFQSPADSFHRNGGVYPLVYTERSPRRASSSSTSSLFLFFPEITQIREIRPSQTSPLSFFTVLGSRVTYSFRINTCKSASKQMTLTLFRMNTYEKPEGGGPLSIHPEFHTRG
jgi:hypothetical protein